MPPIVRQLFTESPPDRPLILVAEEDAEVRRFVIDVLRDEHRIVAVADGEEALAKATAEPPDLVVIDLMMPMPGCDRFVREMRARPSLAVVPLLAVSAKADESVRLELLSKSIQDYVIKPFLADELRARVRNLLVMKWTRDALQKELATQNGELLQLTRQLISSRRTLQHSLEAQQDSERRWRAVYENSAVGIGLTDLSGCFLVANPVLQKMLGYTEDEICNLSLLEITPEEDRETTRSRIAQAAEGRLLEYRLERRYFRKDGSIVWGNTSMSVIPATERAPAMFVKIVEDITERKEAEERLQKAQAELAHVTRVTTMGELAASIAHEVNQPLGAILNNGNVCLRLLAAAPVVRDEMREALSDIVNDANRTGAIIARIRALARRSIPEMTSLRLEDVIADVLTLARRELAERRITVRTETADDLPCVAGDRVQLQQVLLNLVINGVEAMNTVEPRRRTMTICGKRGELRGEPAAVITVRDLGNGFGSADLEQLFEPFYTTKAHGMGMGLRISRSIMEAHGGRLWATANSGAGATFLCAFPVQG
jgi:PAS domain S-box-containing protein